jgi:two-component system CheB/CheR fusion protein
MSTMCPRTPDEYRKLISSFLIKVTEFFRNPELFDYLRERVLPELIAATRRRGNELRLWSAGCATGEEPYSLAILVAEALGDELELFTVRIFATDLDGDAITFARRGVYPAATLAPLSAGLTARYFTPVDDAYEVKKRIRALTVFGQHDLGQHAPFPRIDLCLCRNVLIYFTPELQKRALQIFAFSLRDGSYLALGKAESTSPLTESFAPVNSTLKIYRRGTGSALGQEGLALVPTTRNDVLPLMPSRARAAGRRAPAQPTPDQRRIPTSHDTLGAYLLNTPLGLVVVDRRYDIQAINVAARRQLNIHGPAIGDDLIHLTTILPADAMRAAIDGALRDGTPTSLDEVATTDVETGDATYLRVACYPQRDDEKSPVDVVMILVSDVSAAVRERRALEEGLARQRQDEEQATARMAELVERNRALLQANEELARANMDLRGCSHASTRSCATTTTPVPDWVWACLSHRNWSPLMAAPSTLCPPKDRARRSRYGCPCPKSSNR